MGIWGQLDRDHIRSRRVAEGSAEAPTRPSLVDGAERAVRDWLAPGHYRRGDRLPPEHELAGMLGISRGTLRSALRRLELTGEIVRRQGSGTFVGEVGPHLSFAQQRSRVASYTARTRQELPVRVADVQIEYLAAGERAAGALGISIGERTTVITRAILIDGRPGAVSRDVFHPRLALLPTDQMRAMLSDGLKMVEVLEAAAIEIAFSRTTITPTLLEPEEPIGLPLALTQQTACLDVEEIMFAGADEPLLYSRDIFTPGGMQIEVLQAATDAPAPLPATVRGRSSHPHHEAVQAARGARARS